MRNALIDFLGDYRKPMGVTNYFSEIGKFDYKLLNDIGAFMIYERGHEFVYPEGSSRVICIEKSEKLKNRMHLI